jgi:dolichol-phosphate mannosyltransferase
VILGGRRAARFGVFSFVGAIGALLQVTLFAVLTRALCLPAVAAMPVAVELVVLHNFLWHDRLTWREREATRMRDRVVRLWRFHVANGLVSLAENTIVIYWLVQIRGFPALLSAIIAIALCAPLNFLIADRWVYAPVRRQLRSR